MTANNKARVEGLAKCPDHPDFHVDHKGWCWFADHYPSLKQEVTVPQANPKLWRVEKDK
jgi:hypothetical protein